MATKGDAKKKSRFPLWVIPVALVGVAVLGMAGAFKRYDFDGPAMEPTIRDDDTALVLRAWLAGPPRAGQVGVYRAPDGIEIVKRVVAVGGQTVEIRDDEVFVDGESIRVGDVECPSWMEPLAHPTCQTERIGEVEWQTTQSSLSVPDTVPEVTVEDGCVFVLGDHRDRSNDSRNPRVGVMCAEHYVGRVLGY